MAHVNFNAKGTQIAVLNDGVIDTVKFDNRHSGKAGDEQAIKIVNNFVLGEDIAKFRIDGRYFQDSDIAYNPYNFNQASVSTAQDFIELISTVLSDDGEQNSVEIQGDNLIFRIDADNHRWRTDLKIEFVGVVSQIGQAFDLDTTQGFDQILIGTREDDFLHRGHGIGRSQERGDDLLIGGGGGDTFQFNSTGTRQDKNDGVTPTDHIADLDFDEGDILRLRDWGEGAFGLGLENSGTDGVDVTTLSELESLGNWLNFRGQSDRHSRAWIDGDNVHLGLSHTGEARHQTIVLHGLGDQVSFVDYSAF